MFLNAFFVISLILREIQLQIISNVCRGWIFNLACFSKAGLSLCLSFSIFFSYSVSFCWRTDLLSFWLNIPTLLLFAFPAQQIPMHPITIIASSTTKTFTLILHLKIFLITSSKRNIANIFTLSANSLRFRAAHSFSFFLISSPLRSFTALLLHFNSQRPFNS